MYNTFDIDSSIKISKVEWVKGHCISDDEIYLIMTSSQANQLCLKHLGANSTFCVISTIYHCFAYTIVPWRSFVQYIASHFKSVKHWSKNNLNSPLNITYVLKQYHTEKN